MRLTKQEIRSTVIGSTVGAAVSLCLSLSTNIEQNKSSVEPNIKADTVIVHDTITVHDTIKVEVIKTKKIYIKPKATEIIDYSYLFSLKWKHSDLCSKSRDYAANGHIDLAKLYLAQAKIVGSRLKEYKSHLIYVD